MNFIVFMLCMIFAIFAGMILDRALIKYQEKNEEKVVCMYRMIMWNNKDEPERVLQILKAAFNINGFVRVYDLYFLSGVRAEITDCKFGWNDISQFQVIEKNTGKYALITPKPEQLEK